MLKLYTDESPGLRVDPVVVLVLSLGFIFSVVGLHGMSILVQGYTNLMADMVCSYRQDYSQLLFINNDIVDSTTIRADLPWTNPFLVPLHQQKYSSCFLIPIPFVDLPFSNPLDIRSIRAAAHFVQKYIHQKVYRGTIMSLQSISLLSASKFMHVIATMERKENCNLYYIA